MLMADETSTYRMLADYSIPLLRIREDAVVS